MIYNNIQQSWSKLNHGLGQIWWNQWIQYFVVVQSFSCFQHSVLSEWHNFTWLSVHISVMIINSCPCHHPQYLATLSSVSFFLMALDFFQASGFFQWFVFALCLKYLSFGVCVSLNWCCFLTTAWTSPWRFLANVSKSSCYCFLARVEIERQSHGHPASFVHRVILEFSLLLVWCL